MLDSTTAARSEEDYCLPLRIGDLIMASNRAQVTRLRIALCMNLRRPIKSNPMTPVIYFGVCMNLHTRCVIESH
jgi:hypothetical protein